MIDLKAQFGKRYKVFYDPSWDAETSEQRTIIRQSSMEPWYYELRGPNVVIHPRDRDTVSALWYGHGNAALLKASIGFRRLDGEIVYFVPNVALKGVLDNVKVHRRRQVSEAMRVRGRELAAKYGFSKGHGR